jgi:hypothetical protein
MAGKHHSPAPHGPAGPGDRPHLDLAGAGAAGRRTGKRHGKAAGTP